MKIIKLFLLLTVVTLFLSSMIYDHITLVNFWKTNHINSLIGFQKMIESAYLPYNLNTKIWYYIIVPFLKLEIYLVLTLLAFLVYLFIRRK